MLHIKRTSRQQKAFNQQIGRMCSEGFFLPGGISLAGDTRYLFISYGGTGAVALFAAKMQLENALPKEQLEEWVRFLAIDTDIATKQFSKKVVNPDGTVSIEVVDALSNDQFIHLSGTPARMYLSGNTIAEWINPSLKDRIQYDMAILSGCGASGTRQLGRLSLHPAVTMAAVSAKVQKLAAELTGGNDAPLHIFILSGISGETGSGIVVDATYLIRNALENMPGDVSVRTGYCGFLLLPSVDDSFNAYNIQRGNCNGYAAMKEITHFMTTGTRNGSYRMTYGNGHTVTSQKDIFDACYLIDGIPPSCFTSRNIKELTCQALAEYIQDIAPPLLPTQ